MSIYLCTFSSLRWSIQQRIVTYTSTSHIFWYITYVQKSSQKSITFYYQLSFFLFDTNILVIAFVVLISCLVKSNSTVGRAYSMNLNPSNRKCAFWSLLFICSFSHSVPQKKINLSKENYLHDLKKVSGTRLRLSRIWYLFMYICMNVGVCIHMCVYVTM